MSDNWSISLLSVSVGVVLGFTLNRLNDYLDKQKQERENRKSLIEALHQEIKRNLASIDSAHFLQLSEWNSMDERVQFMVPLDSEAWSEIKGTNYLEKYGKKLINNLTYAYGAIHQYNRVDVLNEQIESGTLHGLDQLRMDLADWLREAKSILEEKRNNT